MKVKYGGLLAVVLVAACATQTNPAPSDTTTSPTPAPSPIEGTPVPSQDHPLEVTTFSTTTSCDPGAGDADLQVVQAFVTAYNQRDLKAMSSLVESNPFFLVDISGIPHLGTDDWQDDLVGWAERGWEVNDQLELRKLVRFGPLSGSTFDVLRTNSVLASHGIEALLHSGKAHSSGCTISQLVLYAPTPEDFDSAECLFFLEFEDDLERGTGQDVSQPRECRMSPSGS